MLSAIFLLTFYLFYSRRILHVLLEECHIGLVPVGIGGMLQFWVEDDILVVSRCCRIIIRCNIGVWRTDVILQTDRGDIGTGNARSQVLRVVIL